MNRRSFLAFLRNAVATTAVVPSLPPPKEVETALLPEEASTAHNGGWASSLHSEPGENGGAITIHAGSGSGTGGDVVITAGCGRSGVGGVFMPQTGIQIT